MSVAFRLDGESLLTASSDHTVRVWNTESCRYRTPAIEEPGGGQAVAFRPDGKSFLAASWGGTARLWDVATKRQVGRDMQARNSISSVACSPVDKTLLVGGDPGATLGRGHLPADRTGSEAPWRGQRRGVQPQRQDSRHRGRGPYNPPLERR